MTKERRELLRELCKKATPGPWLHTWKDCFMCMSSDFIDRKGDDIGIALVTADINQTNAMLYATDIDMDFIAAARTALPELLDEVEAVEAQLREVVAQAKQQLRDEQEASGVDLGKMDRRQDRMVAEMRVLQQRAEAAEASAVVAREALEPLRQLAEMHKPLEWNPRNAAERTELWGIYNKEREVNLTVGDLHRAVNALASSAGAKMLALVKAAREWDGDEWSARHIDELHDAVAALDTEEVVR